MIRHAQWLGSLFMLLLFASNAQADACHSTLIWGKTYVPECVRKYCCDDYRPKTVPCTRGVKTKCCDHYCGKPIPCVREVCTVCNDYRAKCQPKVPCPARELKCYKGYACERCELSAGHKTAGITDILRK